MIKIIVVCNLATMILPASAAQHPVPISNLGNTCFMNAMLQCLLASPFSNQLDALPKNPFPKDSAAGTYFDFVKEYLPHTTTAPQKPRQPTQLCKAVRGKIEQTYSKEKKGARNPDDPMLAFQAIIEETERYVANPFQFFVQEYLSYNNIEELGQQTPQSSLSIAPPLTIATVKTLLQKYFLTQETRQQRLYGSINIEVTVTRRMITLPQLLLVQVERVQPDKSGQLTINTQQIIPSLTLDPQDFGSVGKIPVTYKLFACILFSGTTKGGHYIAQVRYGKQWYNCNDNVITPIKQPTDIPKYITVAFFYEREPLGKPRAIQASAKTAQQQVIPALERLQAQLTELTHQLTPTT